jgi:glycogen phosphorylase
MTSAGTRTVHVLAANAGFESLAELVPALRAGGHVVVEHVLAPTPRDATLDPERLREELALAAGALRDAQADGATLLLADERGAIAVAEGLRVLLDEQKLGWDEAWSRSAALLEARFASPRSEPSRPFWSVPYLEREHPRLLEILFEINRRHLDAVEAAWPGDGGRRRRLSLFRESEPRRLRLGQLALVACGRALVAAPWDGPAGEILADFSVLRGEALGSGPTAVYARRFVVEANAGLAELLEDRLGPSWASEPPRFAELETLAFDPPFRAAFGAMRRANRARLAPLVREAAGIELEPDSLVDVRLGSFAPHERPLLSVLWLVREHLRLAAGGWTPPAPRTVILARAGGPGQAGDERLVRLLRAVAEAINADERVRRALRVAVLPRCDAATEQLLVAGADLANQPGTAGSGASGARALWFAVSGSVMLGTRDGTMRELAEVLGATNMFLFGLGPLETHAWRQGHVYRPRDVYAIDPLVRLALDALSGSRYAPAPGAFDWARDALFDPNDPWLVLADLGAYVHRQDEALAEFRDPRTFHEKAILTLARSRRFWVERLS